MQILHALACSLSLSLLLFSCGHSKPSTSKHTTDLPEVRKESLSIADNIHNSTKEIEEATVTISDKAPDTKVETDSILFETTKLFEQEKRLREVSTKLEAESERAKKADKALVSANKKIAELENERYGLISKLLAFVAVASLIASVIAIFVLKNPRIAIAGGVLFSVCVAAQWLLSYALVIGLVAISLLIGGTVYIIVKDRRAALELVKTVETLKPSVPDFSTTIKGTQSKYTEQLVNKMQRILKVRK